MSMYTPDRWVVLEFNGPSMSEPVHKVFAGWYGGFTSGESWKLNSGIVKTKRNGKRWDFEGYSGSLYRCHEQGYGMSGYMTNVLSTFRARLQDGTTIKILDLDEVVES